MDHPRQAQHTIEMSHADKLSSKGNDRKGFGRMSQL